ncbi:MAG: ATP-binding protein [Pseudomonadales bacterium]
MSNGSSVQPHQGVLAAQQRLLDSAGLGYLEWHQDESRCVVSPGCWKLAGTSPVVDGSYQQWCETVTSTAPEFSCSAMGQYPVALEQPAFNVDLQVLKDHATISLKLAGQVIQRDADGRPVHITALISAHEPQRTEPEIPIVQEKQFEAIANATPIGLWHRDLRAGTSYWSAPFWNLIGRKPQSVGPEIGWFARFAHPEDQAKLLKALKRHFEERAPFGMEVRTLDDAGQTRWLYITGQARWDDAGEPIDFAGSLENITERKRKEDLIESSRGFQALITNTMEDLIFVKDDQFRIQMANDAFLNLYPADIRDTVIGTTTLEAYEPAQREEFLTEDRRALEEGYSEVEETIFFPGGLQRTLWTKKIRFEDQDGHRFVLGYGRDITDLKEAQRALQTANAELEEFAYRVSHDLRSPLQSSVKLLEYLKTALDQGKPGEAKGVLDTVQHSLGSLDNMARDVLDIHRIRHGELSAEALDIEAMVEHILQRHSQDYPDVDISAQCNIQTPAIADAYGMKLVLENLLSNAFKYQNPDTDSTVTVEIKSDWRYLEICVADNGLGIPPENRSKLFGMFQRFHPRQSFGSGLGLYMTRQWAERMGGTISAEHLEPGTRFRVRFPQQHAQRKAL